MKTLIKTFSLLTLSLLGLAFVSCKDKDDNEESLIVGAWQTGSRPLDEIEITHEVVTYLWYKKDGSFIYVDVITDTKDDRYLSYEFSDTGKWSVNGEYVTQSTNFQWDDPDRFDTDVLHFDVNGDILTLSIDYTSVDRQTIQLKRITEERMQDLYNAAKVYYHQQSIIM